MNKFLGVKQILAKEMTLGEYNKYRGWEIPKNESSNTAGYLVEYLDGGKPNHPGHNGYISWSPKEVFEKSYRQTSGLTFGLAIEALKKGMKLARKGWNGKNMFIVYMPPLQLPPYNTADTARKVNDRTAKFIGEDQPLNCQPYLAMYNTQKQWIPGWVATQSDMLSEDWYVVEEA